MDQLGLGNKDNLPTLLPKAHAPVEIFTVHEIAFVERPDIFVRFTPHQHASDGNRLDIDRYGRNRLRTQIIRGEQSRPALAESRQAEGPHELAPGRRHRPPAARLLGPVRVAQ